MMMASVYQAKLQTPVATLGIRVAGETLIGIEFLPRNVPAQPARDTFAKEVCAQLQGYLRDGRFVFDLPLALHGTSHQMKVWRAMQRVPGGGVTTYGAIAAEIDSSPRAVGRACGDNPIPVIVPCHRVVAKNGSGGFMHHVAGTPIDIKHWLLAHEGYAR